MAKEGNQSREDHNSEPTSNKENNDKEMIHDTSIHLLPNDFLFGRGSVINNHEGNIRFRGLVSKRKEEYKSTRMIRSKRKIVQQILDEVHTYGGRFLKVLDPRDPTRWVLANNHEINMKVISSLRMEDSICSPMPQHIVAFAECHRHGGGITCPESSALSKVEVIPTYQELPKWGIDCDNCDGGKKCSAGSLSRPEVIASTTVCALSPISPFPKCGISDVFTGTSSEEFASI